MKNADKQIPVSQVLTNKITAYKFPVDKPIFWGPNQVTVFPSTYNEPTGPWRSNVLLQIPRVARFFFGDGGLLGGKGGTCAQNSTTPPPDKLWKYTSTQWWGTAASLKPAYRGSRIPNTGPNVYTINPSLGLWDSYDVFGDLGIGVMWNQTQFEAADLFGSVFQNGIYDPNTRVTVRNSDGSGSPLYQGPIDSCPYFDLLVYRSVTWIRTRTDNGFSTFVYGISSFNPPGTSGTAPPRCSFVDAFGATLSEQPIDDYLAILGTRGPC